MRDTLCVTWLFVGVIRAVMADSESRPQRANGDNAVGWPQLSGAQIVHLPPPGSRTNVRVLGGGEADPSPPQPFPPPSEESAAPPPKRPATAAARQRAAPPAPPPDGEEEQKLGRRLQRARRQRKLSLASASQALRIREGYLRAMEAGAFSRLPPPPYGSAFVREYSELVRVDPAPILEAYERRHPGESFATDALPHDLPEPRQLHVPRKAVVGAALIVAALTLVGVIGRESSEPGPAPPSRRIASPVAPADRGTTVVVPGQVTVGLVVDGGQSWARVTVDGDEAFEGLLQDGDTRTFSGRAVRVVLGNAGVVRVSVDGRDVGVAGEPGEVFEREFRAQPKSGASP